MASDGEQLTQDRQKNAAQSFANAPDWSLADYYDQSRARTYACCFALQDSPFLWNNYGNHNKRGKVCLVFNFGKLRAILNKALSSSNARIDYGGVLCQQIFNLNYGSVKYIDRRTFQANITRYPNPIEYTFLKDESFSSESELRVSLSAVGVGRFVLDNGSEFQFPRSIQAPFHFQAAGDGTIDSILFEPGFDKGPLSADLKGLGIEI